MAEEKKPNGCGWVIGLFIVLVMVGAALNGCQDSSTSSSGSSSSTGMDSLAEAACRHYLNVVSDAGTLTYEQIIAKLQEVNDSAKYSDYAPVRTAARQVVTDALSDGDWLASGQALMNACT